MRFKSLTLFLFFSFIVAQEGGRYLIITHSNFYDAIRPLAEWKTKKGMKAKVVQLSEIGSSPTQIRSYIQNAYNNWQIRPEYILLVGSPNLLPPYYGWGTDNGYGDVMGDYRADLGYGRFPCKTVAQCSVMVKKSINYERNPDFTDSLWFKKIVTIVREDNDPPDDSIYWQNARYAIQLARDAGFVGFDSFSFFRGHNSSNVVSSINSGRSFVLYRGQAGGNWLVPFNMNPTNMANGFRLPVVISATCATMTLVPNESMVGEAWFKAGTVQNPKGACGFFGSTRFNSNVAPLRSAVARGFFSGLFIDSLKTLGRIALRAKLQLYNEFGNRDEYEGFNLLADPELNLWTDIPKPLQVIYDSVIHLGRINFRVQVRKENNPLKDALVCLRKGDEIYAYGYTDISGEINFDLNFLTTGSFELTVTAYNSLPFEGLGRVGISDVGVTEILTPQVLSDSGIPIIPKAKVKNFGSNSEEFWVRFQIGDSYTDSQYVSQLLPESSQIIEFNPWIPQFRGFATLKCSTRLSVDFSPENDFLFDSVFVRVIDIGIKEIILPKDTFFYGETLSPLVRIKNFGNRPQITSLHLRILYESNQIRAESLLIALDPERDTITTFAEFIPDFVGSYQILAETYANNDLNRFNDTLSRTFVVIALSMINEETPIPGLFNFRIYPTITSSKVVLHCLSKEPGICKIYNNSGRLVKSFSLLKGNSKILLDFEESGVFFISLKLRNFETVKKVLRIRN